MSIENHVISLDYARRLFELGVKQDSLFYWVSLPPPNDHMFVLVNNLDDNDSNFLLMKSFSRMMFSAFLASELGKIIPIDITIKGYMKRLKITNGFNWHISYDEIETQDYNEAKARAKMLIHLIENKIWSPE